MKRTMNEYNDSMKKIVPSESFISETEALMRKLRDEQNECNNKETALKTSSEEVRKIDISSNSRTIRIKKWTIGLSAAAAVMICAVSLNVYNKTNVDSSMTQDVETEVSETTAAVETTVPENDEETSDISETTTISTAEETEEAAVETSVPEISEEEEITSSAKNNTDKKESDKKSQETQSPSADEQDSDFSAEPNDSHGINAANTVDDDNGEALGYAAPDSSEYHDETNLSDTEYSEWSWVETDNNAYYDEEEIADDDPDLGAPVWVPSFIDENSDEDVVEDDLFEEDTDDDSGFGISVTSYETEPTYSLGVSFKSALSGADEVYVPDTISDLDDGEYYIYAEAGFDEVDPSTGELIAAGGVNFSESDAKINSAIIAEICRVTEEKAQYHYDEETKMYDYRYKLTIYSADESEDNAKLFEIIFNKGELVINRYDNGTVSSEKYIITAEEYAELDSYIRSLS